MFKVAETALSPLAADLCSTSLGYRPRHSVLNSPQKKYPKTFVTLIYYFLGLWSPIPKKPIIIWE
ncbi:hypothetical protein TorRG33x02_287400 [Trema orientale]|uniref:Uncharacterized protein n=1 Tax=Trema orientale TaxID=63057 RepID=A0A2P5CF67_TREOI|nr:hypothetical protein TorRG33x02_287400 [Trema orientale]